MQSSAVLHGEEAWSHRGSSVLVALHYRGELCSVDFADVGVWVLDVVAGNYFTNVSS